MALSEIEKLERRYAENPQGLTFAPLAEVHRKNGDVTRALELLRPGLAIHPDYIPASIVLGRCHLDLGDLPAAEAAFSHVLSLDGENVIALKALADVAERQHHFDQAERWLTTLLAVDRSNEEARTQLERIETARRDAASAPPPPLLGEEPVAEPQPDTPPPAEVPAGEAAAVPTPEPEPVLSAASEEPPSRQAEPAPDQAEDIAPLPLEDLEPALAMDDEIEPPPPGLEIEEPEVLEAPVEPLAGLIGRDVDEVEPSEADFRVELSEDIVLRSSGGGEFQVPDAAAELFDRERPAPLFGSFLEPPKPPELESASPAPPPAVEQPPGPATTPEAALTPEAAGEPEPARAPEAPAQAEPGHPTIVPQPELVVTESMAEVLLQQGHSAEALRVYRELEVRHTGDPRLLQKIADLEAESAAGLGLEAPGGGSPAPEPASVRRAYTAADTGGQSVREFFQSLLAARPAGAATAPPAARSAIAAPADAGGAPTRPAADALSLSSVFGEETTPLPPAVPAAGGGGANGVSFDEFYGTPAGSTGKPRAPDPKSDDLDQFHAWLQNLKR